MLLVDTSVDVMYYVVYKITNKNDGKIYVGYHSTNNINDDYMGSGHLIREAIGIEGIHNFSKEILHVYDNEMEARYKEAEIVTPEFVESGNVYNLNCGGYGSNYYVVKNGLTHTKEANKKRSKAMKEWWSNTPDFRVQVSERMTNNNPMKDPEVAARATRQFVENPPNRGRFKEDHPTFELVTVFDTYTNQYRSVSIHEYNSNPNLITEGQQFYFIIDGIEIKNNRVACIKICNKFDCDIDLNLIQNNKASMTKDGKLTRKHKFKSGHGRKWSELGIIMKSLKEEINVA